jgi:hypothetical protein
MPNTVESESAYVALMAISRARAGRLKFRAGHEYLPNLPQPKGFKHCLPGIAFHQRSHDDGRFTVMNASTNTEPDLATFREELEALKRDVASLIEHIGGGRRTEFTTPPTKLVGPGRSDTFSDAW